MAIHETVRPAELLRELGREYHRVQQNHMREPAESSVRRRLKSEMERIADRFERVLAFWAAGDDGLHAAWRRHLHEGAEAPDRPEAAAPPLFAGENQSGSRIELRPAVDGGYDLMDDGTLLEHQSVPWHLNPDSRGLVQIGPYLCRERFDAPPEAIRALASFVRAPESEPPRRWSRELFADGLIDSEFALTPRGRRLFVPPAPAAEPSVTCCVIAADAGRARILTLELRPPAKVAALVELEDLTNPSRRARDSDLYSETRPGIKREGGIGPRHGLDDRRDRQREEGDRRFADQVAEQAAKIWRRYPSCQIILAAPPKMLGHIRPAIARRRTGPSPTDIHELARDLTRLAPAALHDALADAALLPPRERLIPDAAAAVR